MMGEVLVPAPKGAAVWAWRCALLVTTMLVAPGIMPAGAQTAAHQTATHDTARPMVLAQADRQHAFDISAQPLADALALFGRQSGMQILAHGDLVRGLRSGDVRGRMTAETALQRLLAGTGLSYRIGGDGSITVQPGTAGNASGAVLGPITVEGSRAGERIGAADRAASIAVGSADLERRNPATVKEVFAGEAGISVGGAIPLSQKVYVHGVEETNLAVSIDGARQNNKVFHHNATNLIDPSLLKAARVDPGVAPADAGPGALGGAIVYETVDVADLLEPGRALGGFVTTSFDTDSGTFTNGNAAYGRIDGAEVLGFFKWGKGDDFSGGDGSQVPGTGTDMRSGLFKTAFDSSQGRIELSAEQVRDRAPRPYRANIGRLTNRNDPPERQYDLTRRNLVFNYSMPEAEGLWDPKVVLAYAATEVAVPVTFGSVGKTGGLSGRVENDFNLSSRDTITAGFDFYDDEAEYYDNTTSSISEKAINAGLYAQARLQPLDPLRLSFGMRGDRQRFEGLEGTAIDQGGLSGNASAAFDVNDFVTLRAGYSNVWGGVALSENYIFNPNWNYSAGIKPVRARNYTSGFDVHYEGFSFGAGVFRSDFSNARDATYNGGPSILVDFETRGYDLGAGYSWGAGFLRLTYTDSEITLNGAPTDSDATQYLGTPVGRILSLEASHRFEDLGIRIGGTIDAALKNRDNVSGGNPPLPAYEVVSLYTEYQPEQAPFLTFRIELNNLFDETYADRATYGQEFGNVQPLLEPGRSVLLMAKARF